MTESTQRIISVLGMHRSGTSCLAGSLEHAGVFFGDVQRKNPHNLKGNRENLRIMELHDDLLASSGGSWDDPPERVVWSDRHREIRDRIVGEYGDSPLWGFKDPRALFVLEGWLEKLPQMEFVGTFRHPLKTARSLFERNRFPIEQGMEIWRRYNERLLCLHDRFAFPLVSFDLDEGEYRRKLVEIFGMMNLPSPADAPLFFDPDLRHDGREEPVPLPPSVSALYDELCRRSS